MVHVHVPYKIPPCSVRYTLLSCVRTSPTSLSLVLQCEGKREILVCYSVSESSWVLVLQWINKMLFWIFSERAQRLYDQERKRKQDRAEMARERWRETFRQKYGINGRTRSEDGSNKAEVSCKACNQDTFEVSRSLNIFDLRRGDKWFGGYSRNLPQLGKSQTSNPVKQALMRALFGFCKGMVGFENPPLVLSGRFSTHHFFAAEGHNATKLLLHN